MISDIIIDQNKVYQFSHKLLDVLLTDRTTHRHIIWATNNYQKVGISYQEKHPITCRCVINNQGQLIKPRIMKSKEIQGKRVKDKAEVFTPAWICNYQNNIVDELWFDAKDVFNIQKDKSWITNQKRIVFPIGKTWQDYVNDIRLEITCGEAPYLASRYDMDNGQLIPVNNRIGILDRKLRVINENTNDFKEWYLWVKKAYQATYGFEWQGDNLLIARENLLITFVDNYQLKFHKKSLPNIKYLLEIAHIISWNIWQMDGLKGVIPNSCHPIEEELSIDNEAKKTKPCPGCKKHNMFLHNGIYCKIYDWERNSSKKFISLVQRTA